VAQDPRPASARKPQLTASAGVAPNKFLAKIASDWNKPDGLFVIRRTRSMPSWRRCRSGKLPGVGKVMEARLAELGVGTVGELRALGSAGRWRRASDAGAAIARTVARHRRAPRLSRPADAVDFGRRHLVLKLKTGDFRLLTRSVTPSTPPRSLEQFLAHALELRARVDLPARTRYRLAGVGLGNFVERDDPRVQAGLFDS
jgi:DNA polymerase-4